MGVAVRVSRGDARKMGIVIPSRTRKSTTRKSATPIMPKMELSDWLLAQMRMAGLPEPIREHRFHEARRWRFDLAYPDRMIAIECEGLVRPESAGGDRKSRHTTNRGYEMDCEKYDAAVLTGWRLLRFTGAMIKSGAALNTIELALQIWHAAPLRRKGDR